MLRLCYKIRSCSRTIHGLNGIFVHCLGFTVLLQDLSISVFSLDGIKVDLMLNAELALNWP